MNTNYLTYLLILIYYIFNCDLFGKIYEQHSVFHEKRIIVKAMDNISFNQIETDNDIAITGYNQIDKLNRQLICTDISRLFIKYKGNQHLYKKFELGDYYIFSFEKKQNISKIIDLYLQTGYLISIEPDYKGFGGSSRITPDDMYYYGQWSMENNGTYPDWHPGTVDADIDMERAWGITQGSSDVTVGILDTGLKLDHPEFSNRIWVNVMEETNGSDDDANGYIDDLNGWDFANQDNYPIDDHGHGTNVGGIVGATGNNSIGYAGMDWNCKLMSLKILDSENSGYYSWWSAAIYYATNHGAKILNMSVGGSSYSSSMETAVNYAYEAGTTIFACMMNANNNTTYYPAGYNNTIAVGATDTDDSRCSPFSWGGGSNFGNHIDISAPGNIIYGLNPFSDINYSWYWSGTSQATPHAAGLASLMLGIHPQLTPDQIKDIMINSSQDTVGSPTEDILGWDQYHGWGRINAYNTINYITADEDVDDIYDMYDNCLQHYNPEQIDSDLDGMGDNCDGCNNENLSSFINGNLDSSFDINDEPIIDIFDLISLLLDIDEESQDDCSKISADMDDNDVLNNIDIGILITLIFG